MGFETVSMAAGCKQADAQKGNVPIRPCAIRKIAPARVVAAYQYKTGNRTVGRPNNTYFQTLSLCW